MDPKSLPDTQYLERVIVERTEAGQHPEATLAELIATGLSCDEATDLMVTELEKRLGVLQTTAQRNVAATQDDSVEALRKLTVPNPRRTRTGPSPASRASTATSARSVSWSLPRSSPART